MLRRGLTFIVFGFAANVAITDIANCQENGESKSVGTEVSDAQIKQQKNMMKDAMNSVTNESIGQQAKQSRAAVLDAEKLQTNDEIKQSLARERAAMNSIPNDEPPRGQFTLPNYVKEDNAKRYLERALRASGGELKSESIDSRTLLIFISTSMSDVNITDLIKEARTIGATLVLRGLIGNNVKATKLKLAQLANGGESSIIIDPTLFSRFEVASVPTYVMPLGDIEACSPESCTTPPYAKMKGGTLRYFLEYAARNGQETELQEAKKWLTKYSVQ